MLNVSAIWLVTRNHIIHKQITPQKPANFMVSQCKSIKEETGFDIYIVKTNTKKTVGFS